LFYDGGMKFSELFTKTRREAPEDEEAVGARWLVRAGYIYKEMAGVYSFLPLGWRTLEKTVQLIKKEMEALGGIEVSLSAIQDGKVWAKTDRFDDQLVDIWFKTKLKSGMEIGLAFTHEEPLTRIMKHHIHSFRDLPRYVYQFQTKFRNETRAKSGLIRTREFLMKDLYSFSKDEASHQIFYEKVKEAYSRIFAAAGVGDKTFLTFASGGTFSRYSHEFQTETLIGEDTIHVCDACRVAINQEIIDEQQVCPQCGRAVLRQTKAVEVGNIFTLGVRFSEAFGLTFLDEKGKKQKVFMGSYGIGPARLIGVVAEVLSDKNGLVWPKTLSPFDAHLVLVAVGNEGKVKAKADALYHLLQKAGISVLYDDRDLRAGEKFIDADLIGLPKRLVVSNQTLKTGKIEVKDRLTGQVTLVPEAGIQTALV
jgi:prolyl-tRNA synthetase